MGMYTCYTFRTLQCVFILPQSSIRSSLCVCICCVCRKIPVHVYRGGCTSTFRREKTKQNKNRQQILCLSVSLSLSLSLSLSRAHARAPIPSPSTSFIDMRVFRLLVLLQILFEHWNTFFEFVFVDCERRISSRIDRELSSGNRYTEQWN